MLGLVRSCTWGIRFPHTHIKTMWRIFVNHCCLSVCHSEVLLWIIVKCVAVVFSGAFSNSRFPHVSLPWKELKAFTANRKWISIRGQHTQSKILWDWTHDWSYRPCDLSGFLCIPIWVEFHQSILYKDHMYGLQTHGNHSRCFQGLRVIVVNLSQGYCYNRNVVLILWIVYVSSANHFTEHEVGTNTF